MKRPLPLPLCLACLVLLLSGSRASAHANLERAEPAVGSEVGKPPTQVKLWFSQELEPTFSRVQVFDSGGKQIDKKDVRIDPKDHKLMTISVPGLPPGKYKVVWKVVSIDTHRTTGTFHFTVK